MAIPIQTISSETAIWRNMTQNFRKYRVLDYIAFYLGTGADYYNHPDNLFSPQGYDYPKIAQLIADILPKNTAAKTAIVSLGCGSCENDRRILEHLQALGHTMPFVGVDASMAMLHKAQKALEGVTFDTRLLFADFSTEDFEKELNNIVDQYDLRIYLFMGNTLSNFHQSYITNKLSNMLHTGDYLLLDVAGCSEMPFQIHDKVHGRHTDSPANSPEKEFLLHPLKVFGVPEHCGKITLTETDYEAAGAQEVTFGFRVHTSCGFNLEGMEINLYPNDLVELHHVLTYNLTKLARYLEEKNLIVKEKVGGECMNQLLLEKQ